MLTAWRSDCGRLARPAEVLTALEAIDEPSRRHYFWTGRGEAVTTVN